MLSPVLTQAMVEEALRLPLEISNAERAIAVAYPGHRCRPRQLRDVVLKASEPKRSDPTICGSAIGLMTPSAT